MHPYHLVRDVLPEDEVREGDGEVVAHGGAPNLDHGLRAARAVLAAERERGELGFFHGRPGRVSEAGAQALDAGAYQISLDGPGTCEVMCEGENCL